MNQEEEKIGNININNGLIDSLEIRTQAESINSSKNSISTQSVGQQSKSQNKRRLFEIYACFFMIWNYCTGDYLIYNLAFLELEPVFECEERSKIAMIGAAYFIGYSLSCLFVPRLSDIKGRRIPYLMSNLIQLFIYFGILFATTVDQIIVFILIFGLCGPGRSIVGYLYLLELVPKDWKYYIGTLISCANTSTFVFSSFFFWYASKNSEYLIIFGLISTLFTLTAIYQIPESPKYLKSTNQLEKLEKTLAYIDRFNRSKEIKANENMAEQVVNIQDINIDIDSERTNQHQINKNVQLIKKQKKIPKKTALLHYMLKDKVLLMNLLIMTSIVISSQFNYFLIAFNIKYLPGNIYLNIIISASAEIVFLLLSSLFIKAFGLKKSFIIGFSVSLVGSFTLIFYSEHHGFISILIILLTRVGMASIMNASYLGFSVLFPTQYSQTSFGFAKLMGRVVTIFAPFIAELDSPIPMIAFTILTIIGLISTIFIRIDGKLDMSVEIINEKGVPQNE
ncbi:solute carrier family member 5 [Stylonychia lemnae]|uniref:Solute carrier family member 5 n=1 Tax=Stylonychia lemnae TaxID=5949 RepID=A0A077ZX97_STYLE|nr:solute carrier family member 5 [Stylonychia lemnae]|eukprot:CDW73161.1 solute carrier family member 5 [Stylonychia lemnae]